MKETSQEPIHPPPQVDPLRLAGVTIRAVDQIGTVAAQEIERAAAELNQSANEIIDEIRTLADAIRSHTKVTSDRVSNFCSKATSIVEGVRELQDRFGADERDLQRRQTVKSGLSLPKLIGKAQSNRHDLSPDKGSDRVATPTNGSY